MGGHETETRREVGIVGYGRFGRSLAELCREHGLDVFAFDPSAAVPPELALGSVAQVASRSRVLIACVPVPELPRVLSEVVPASGGLELVLDVGSVKLAPIAALRQGLGGSVPWIGTHPLFGPTSLALGERPLHVVLCPTPEHPTAAPLARSLFERIGCEVIEQDADAHDRAMADTHALAFFVAKGMMDVRAGEGVRFVPGSFQAIARTIESVRSDAGHLFQVIQRDNPHAAPARRRLLEALARVDVQLARPPAATPPESAPELDIPSLPVSPALQETRELIDALDRELVALLARRAALSSRAGRAKAALGKAVRDEERERALLAARAEHARELGIDPGGVREVFEAILRSSRSLQEEEGGVT